MAKSVDAAVGERERSLMEATLRIVGRAGLDGVTHRAVAAEAGVSVGAVTHHFRIRDELIESALRFALSRELTKLRTFTLALQDKAFDADAWIDALVKYYAGELKSDPETHIACYEAFLVTARTAKHRAIVTEWFAVWRQSAELAMRAAGSKNARQDAEIFVATLLGLLLKQLAAPRRGFVSESKVALTRLVARFAAS
jgi:DNA-binding transcriptional regulator YbjK